MIEDKEYRQQLLESYLDAGTTVEEEIALAQYYATHTPDADEAAAAALILAGYPQAAILSEEGEKFFDSTVSRRLPARRIWLATASIAAAAALFFLFHPIAPLLIMEKTIVAPAIKAKNRTQRVIITFRVSFDIL